ncbi:MAG: peptide chain release factor 1 [Actinobacteria bacterium]|nr:peptide chain release factor 1 [Actinomycetota bacterium]
MLDQFQELEQRFEDLELKMSDPEVISDQKKYQELVYAHSELKQGVEQFREYQTCVRDLAEARAMLSDPEMAELAQEEINGLEESHARLEMSLKRFLVPADPNDHRNAIVEIRAGTGGEEASLFCAELYRMYQKYSDTKQWKVEVMSQSLTGLGGVKEICFLVAGKQVFSRLKFESGTHRVQRVPETEASGRVHTSAATVAILPEVEAVDVDIETKDLRIDTYRASGAGGQHVNKTDSAVRITHIPTGLVVACQDERSQFQNKDRCMRLLRAKLYEKQVEDQAQASAQARKIQVGSGDRSQKIRTYNYPQRRVTDHRINMTLYTLEAFLQGDMEGMIDALIAADCMEKLQGSQ